MTDALRAAAETDGHAAPRAVRNSALNLLSQVAYGAMHLGSIAILARSLGVGEFGRYFTLFALVLVVQLAAELGLGTALTRRLVHRPDAARTTLAQAFALFLAIATASAAAFLAAGALMEFRGGAHVQWQHFALAGLACGCLQLQRFCTGAFRAMEAFGPENKARLLQGAAFSVSLLLLALWQALSLTHALAAYASSHGVAAGFLLSLHRRTWGALQCRIGWDEAGRWLRESVHVGVGDTVRGFTWQLDTLLLGWLRPAAEVGIYSVAYRPLGPLNWIPRAVTAATFTSFARFAVTDARALERSVAGTIRILWVVSLPLAVLLFVCAEAFVRILAGADYLEAVVPLRILVWIACFSFVSYPLGSIFTSTGRPQLYARLAIATFAIELVLELFLIPAWGYLGACAGSLAGEVFFAVCGLALCHRQRVLALEWRRLAAAVLCALTMALVLWPLRHLPVAWLAVAGAAASMTYASLCVAAGALTTDEVARFLRGVRGKAAPFLAAGARNR